jgi:crotonobetainyl-CoA:carnitine CoA-transferase CaiB-like acyl-CoA transferase
MQASEHAEAGPLRGIRVLDFGHTVMGPAAGLILADLGAEVIRIEPASGDPTRSLRGFGTGYFPFYNRNKRSLAVDLKTPEGQEAVHRLLAISDAMLENFAAGTIDRLGFSYETVAERHPHIVYLSLKGYLPGPYQDRNALDEVVQMMSGLAYMTGPPGQPLRAGASVVDVMGGLFGAFGIVLALRERDRTGTGTLVRTSLFESAMLLMGQHLAYAALTDVPVPPMPARVSAWAIYDQFATADGQGVFLGITSDRHWARFCRAFGRDDLAVDPDFATNNDRIAARDRLKPMVAEMLAALPRAVVEERCLEAGLPYARISRPEDMFDDPHLLAGDRLLRTILPGGVETRLPGLPLEIGPFKTGLRSDPPVAGQDTRALLQAVGYDDAEIDDLVRRRILVDGAA